MQYSTRVRDDRLDQIARTVGPTPILELRSGDAPPNCQAPATGVALARGQLPVEWMKRALMGLKTMAGPWQITGVAKGKIGYFRLYDFAGVTCHVQGVIGVDMEVDTADIVPKQAVNVTLFNLRTGNA